MSDQSDSQQPTDAEGPDDPKPCTVCRATGVVLSNLGGSLSEQTCPWCEGSKVQLPEHDAQAFGETPT